MSTKADLIAAAERVADNAIAEVIDAIQDAIEDRRENALWWYHFHDAMLASLPRIRWIARIRQRNARRRALARVRANAKLRAVCPASWVMP